MSTISDVQNAIVDIISAGLYPNGTNQPSVAANKVTSFTVTNGGSGYTTATVTLSGGDGFGAFALANIVAGVITNIHLVNLPGACGYGYTTAPTVTITGDGTGAAATAVLSPIVVSVFPGDALKFDLDNLLPAGDAVVQVLAIRPMTRNTTRFNQDEFIEEIDEATIFTDVDFNQVTLTGSVTVGQSVMVIANDVGYAYAAVQGDTLNSMAAALALLIPNAVALNNIITIANIYSLEARVGVEGTAIKILRSQEGIFRVRVIAPRHELRELIGETLATAIDENGYYLPMPDHVDASIRGKDITELNTYELKVAFVRDYNYLIEYHTTKVTQYHTITDPYALITVN